MEPDASPRGPSRPYRWFFYAAVLILTAGLLGACAPRAPAVRPAVPRTPVCHECFWRYQNPEALPESVAVYEARRYDDRLVNAELSLLLGRLRGDVGAECYAFRQFRDVRRQRSLPRRLMAEEAMAFTAASCGLDPLPFFEKAASTASRLGQGWKAGVYRAMARGAFSPEFGEAGIGRRIEVPPGTDRFILGESAIRVGPDWRIGVQVERTVRDWLSYRIDFRFGETPVDVHQLLDYHEGARLRNILEGTPARPVPLTGTIVARRGDRWLAPDENGVFRFEVLSDKIWYPTTRAYGDIALLVDTHGVSSLVERAVNSGVQMVMACGDYTAKVAAAYHLAMRGVHVYFPCDRYVGELLGYEAPGTLIGSAPVRAGVDGSVIGDRPIEFSTDETIVVEDTTKNGPLQYYDAPARYFRRLGELLPLRLEIVEIDEAGQAGRVVDRALEMGATAIALRVWNEEDYRPVRDWLAGSDDRRAVLFHTAAYPAGYRLFEDFPRRTTFGDPRPRFLTPDMPRAGTAPSPPAGGA